MVTHKTVIAKLYKNGSDFMSKLIDLTGQRFGRLTVIKRAENNKYGAVKWVCRCDCGKIIKCFSTNLRNGHSKSCGCFQYQDLTGERFGRLTVISLAGKKKGFYYWNCKCDCGNEAVIKASYLTIGDTKSCGCLYDERNTNIKHGYSGTRLYRILGAMKTRCYNTKFKEYSAYGGRGITVCKEWLDKENGIANFCKWAIKNGYRDGLEIDRINNDGNYEPSNCRWVSAKQNSRNRRDNVFLTINDETKCVSEWCETVTISPYTIYEWVRKYGKEYAEKRISEKMSL